MLSILGLIATIIGIFAFITGIQSLPSVFERKSSPKRSVSAIHRPTSTDKEPTAIHRPVIIEKAATNSSIKTSASWTGNNGETGYRLSNVLVQQIGNTIKITYDYKVWDRQNPTAIVQVLVGLDRDVVGVIYNGIPGSGDSGSGSISFPVPGRERDILIAGTWTTSVSKGKYHFERENGGWIYNLGHIDPR